MAHRRTTNSPGSGNGPSMTLTQKALMFSALLNVGLLAGHLARGPLPSMPEGVTLDGGVPAPIAAAANTLAPAEVEGSAAAEASGPSVPVPSNEVNVAAAPSAAPDADPAENAAAAAAAAGLPPDLQVTSVTIQRNIPSSLEAQLDRTTATMLSQTLTRVLVWNLTPHTDLRPGDRLQVAWTLAGEDITIWALRFESQKYARTFRAYRYESSLSPFASWYDERGVEVPAVLNNGPIASYEQITSLLHDRPDHHGMDFMTPVGTPITAPFAGTVTNVDWNLRFNGNCVELRGNDGVTAKFLHLSETSVQVGQTVTPGTPLGLSGNTGRSTGPHLHYELERGGRVLDPIEYHGVTHRPLPEAEQGPFLEWVGQLGGLFSGT
jgi:murein DD-endopeptidase MepM/ murein hydrolase activator NlpD